MSFGSRLLHRFPQCCAFAVVLLFSGIVTAQQDLQFVARTLAGQIAESGKRSAAVVDFTDLQGTPTELGRYLAEELSVALAIQAKAIKVVDRAHLKAIIQEHRLSSTGLIDPQTARKLGQIAGVDVLVTGTMVPFSDNVRLSVKALDTSTAQILAATMHDVPLTQRIREMISAGSTVTNITSQESSVGKPKSPLPASMTVTENNFVFVVKSCRRSGENLTCSGSITNTYNSARTLQLYRTQLIDDEGVEYQRSQPRIGTSGASSPLLQSNLTVNFTIDARGGAPTARAVTLILWYVVSGTGGRGDAVNHTGLMLRNMPVTGR